VFVEKLKYDSPLREQSRVRDSVIAIESAENGDGMSVCGEVRPQCEVEREKLWESVEMH
jgi:hypothetical protein